MNKIKALIASLLLFAIIPVNANWEADMLNKGAAKYGSGLGMFKAYSDICKPMNKIGQNKFNELVRLLGGEVFFEVEKLGDIFFKTEEFKEGYDRMARLGCKNTRNMMEIQNTYEFYFKDTVEKENAK